MDPYDPLRPERELLKHILVRAIKDATGNVGNSDAHVILQARRWLRSNSKRPFSYLWICAQLDRDAHVIRNFVRDQVEPVFVGKGKRAFLYRTKNRVFTVERDVV